MVQEIVCSRCGKGAPVKLTARNLVRLPRGWKRLDGQSGQRQPTCQACVSAAYTLRAVTLPIAKPLDRTWVEFREVIAEQWKLSAQCATWMIRELYIRDEAREQQPKLPKMRRQYLYPEAVRRFPLLTPTTVSALEQAMQAKYRTQRYGVVWTLDEQLQTLRYPQPLIVPAANWSISCSEDARRDLLLSVRIARDNMTLRLRSGRDFARQRRDLEQIIAGTALKGELAIYRKRAQGTDRAGSGGQKSSALGSERGANGHVRYDVMVKLVGRFPRRSADRSGTLFVRSDSDSLLVALNAKDERLWMLNADHVRRWCAEHSRRLQRWSDDQKAESRPIPPFSDRRSAAAVKFRNRIHSFCLQAAAQVVNYAKRRRLAEIKYDDSDKRFLDRFDWSGLRASVANKCAAEGIVFTPASGGVSPEIQQPLEQED